EHEREEEREAVDHQVGAEVGEALELLGADEPDAHRGERAGEEGDGGADREIGRRAGVADVALLPPVGEGLRDHQERPAEDDEEQRGEAQGGAELHRAAPWIIAVGASAFGASLSLSLASCAPLRNAGENSSSSRSCAPRSFGCMRTYSETSTNCFCAICTESFIRSRKMLGKRPMTKIIATRGARTMISRRLRSLRCWFLGFEFGPKNIFCTTESMYTAARM